MDSFTVILISAFFFIMGAALIGFMWYFQRITRPRHKKNSNSSDPNLSELARLIRNLQTKELVVKMDGKLYEAVDELSPTQLRRLIFASNVLVRWLGQPTPKQGQNEEPPLVILAPPAEPGIEELLPTVTEEKPVENRSSYIPPFAAGSMEQVKPVSTEIPDMVGGLLTPTPKVEPEFKSIASQINDILQEQLVGTDLEFRGIAVSDGHDRGVMVTLDGNKYEGVMDVPDEDVRRAIRAAVVEWETRK